MVQVAGLLAGLVASATAAATLPAGGALTHPEHNRDAFTRPAPSLDAQQLRAFQFGNRIFNTGWTVAPASASGFDGLGPLFNRTSCSGCHLRDGRGRPPIEGETQLLSMLVRISQPAPDPADPPVPVPAYGDQLQDRAIPGVAAEASVRIEWEEQPGTYADGTLYSLRKPVLHLENPAYGPLPEDLQTSARVAPAVFGLGLLEAIPAAALRAAADPDDADGDGISGRVNEVHDPVSQSTRVGRFGWKANAASLEQQNTAAALGDIGLTSRHFPTANCTAAQTACSAAPHGGEPELPDLFVQRLTEYMQMLGVPAQRPASDLTRIGAQVFARLGCAACHTPQQHTGKDHPLALLHDQTFLPYTDLLLHDLGPDLADGRPDHLASGQEWRTPPLWGIGLYPTTNGHQLLLHDGRARGIAEAILWHGGEAETARERFRQANAADRDALIAFLQIL